LAIIQLVTHTLHVEVATCHFLIQKGWGVMLQTPHIV